LERLSIRELPSLRPSAIVLLCVEREPVVFGYDRPEQQRLGAELDAIDRPLLIPRDPFGARNRVIGSERPFQQFRVVRLNREKRALAGRVRTHLSEYTDRHVRARSDDVR
jgi:hypothetical protein